MNSELAKNKTKKNSFVFIPISSESMTVLDKDSMKLFLWINEWPVDSFLGISVLKIFFYKPDFPLRSYLFFYYCIYDLIPDLRI